MVCHSFSGYAYLSVYATYGIKSSTAYHPKLQDVIWDGVLSIELYQPSGPEWQAFTHAVIDGSQDPVWAPYLHQPPNSSQIATVAGKFCTM